MGDEDKIEATFMGNGVMAGFSIRDALCVRVKDESETHLFFRFFRVVASVFTSTGFDR